MRAMIWYVLGVLVALAMISSIIPTTRRIWVFHIFILKYLALWILDLVQIRRLILKLRGKQYRKLSRPLAMRLFAEDMGPTFIKFGQIVASSSGVFPDRYVEEFRKCLDRVRPFAFEEVKRTLERDLGEERFNKLVDLDPKPLASASMAQVHTASLPDGTKVVVKVQRPGIDRRIAADMKIMRFLARVAAKLVRDAELANPVGVVEDFAKTLNEELDFRLEAKNLDRFNEIIAELGHKNIRAPKPHWDLTTRKVLVMERFYGLRVDQVEEILARGIDAESRLVDGLRAWFQCVVFYGFFHGDVHAGNLMLLDNEDLGFLDFGIVGRFDDFTRRLVTDYLVAFSTGNYLELGKIIAEMGGVPIGLDMDAFAADLKEVYSPMLEMSFGDLKIGELIPKVHRVATKHRMSMPKEFVLITKQLLYFDRYAKLLAPNLNVFTDPRLLMSMMLDIKKAREQMAG